MSEAPDLAAPVVGWRAWSLRAADGFTLGSPVVREFTWAPRAATTARCLRGCAEPPGWDCGCGLYALTDLPVGLTPRHIETVVLGCVALWGRVVEATHGYRGARGYPLALFAPAGAGLLGIADLLALLRLREAGLAGPQTDQPEETLGRVLAQRYAVPVRPLPRTSVLVRGSRDRGVSPCAAAVRDEAGRGLAARRLGDRDARERFDRALDDLAAALAVGGG